MARINAGDTVRIGNRWAGYRNVTAIGVYRDRLAEPTLTYMVYRDSEGEEYMTNAANVGSLDDMADFSGLPEISGDEN